METYDVAVIGMGPGGEHVAGTLAERGLRVLGIDNGLVGGECPYWGCIPSKMMIRAANALAEARRVPELGGSIAGIHPDWAPVARRIREEATDNWDDRVAVERFVGKGGTFVRGKGRLTGPGRVDVDGVSYTLTRGVVVATGSKPAIPPIAGLDQVPFWTNHEAVETKELPASMIVLGGGAIGCYQEAFGMQDQPAGPTQPPQVWTRWAWTLRPGSPRSTIAAASPTESGRSVTSPDRAPSPTSPCIRLGS